MSRKYINLLLVFGIVISVISSVIFIHNYQQQEKMNHFEVAAAKMANHIEHEYTRMTYFLESLDAFFQASNFVEQDEWKQFLSSNNSLKAGEFAAYILFNEDQGSEELLKKYNRPIEHQLSYIYTYPGNLQGGLEVSNFKSLAKGQILFDLKINDRISEVLVWPHKKEGEVGLFLISSPANSYNELAKFENLEFELSTDQDFDNKFLIYKKAIILGDKQYTIIIKPGEKFDFGVSVLPLLSAVGFVGILILLLIVKSQRDNNRTNLALNQRLKHDHEIFAALNISTAKYSGDEFFKKLCLELRKVFRAEYSFVTKIESNEKFETIAGFRENQPIDTVCYFKAGTPCEVVAQKREVVYYPENIQTLFPEDQLLIDMGVNSYLGTPIISRNNELVGLIVLLDKDKISFNDHLSSVLKIFADRCAVEMERKKNYDEIVRSKEELVELKDKAVNASKAKSEFLAVMSHEIRTPLNGIVGSLNLLQETGGLSPEQQDFVSTINFSSDSLMQIINDILDFSKIEAGKMTLEKIPFSLKQIMDGVKCIFIPVADEKGLEFLAPEPSNIGNYKGDPGRIRQVIINLVNNALKFTKEGSVVVMTKITDEGDNRAKITISVEDTGIGISKENQAKIFDSFSQEDSSTTRKFGGTGLGLSICKKLTKMMGGDLSVTSVLGEGATFTAEIYLDKAEEDINLAAQTAGHISSFHGKVLLVEDNAVNKKIATKILQKMHLEVETAENGQEALDMCHSQQYDLIFMDVMMPVMDGLEATEKLRTEGNKTPIVAMTANAFEEDKRKCLDAGMDGFLTKPLKKNDIIIELDRFLDAS